LVDASASALAFARPSASAAALARTERSGLHRQVPGIQTVSVWIKGAAHTWHWACVRDRGTCLSGLFTSSSTTSNLVSAAFVQNAGLLFAWQAHMCGGVQVCTAAADNDCGSTQGQEH
jgi:hypothetical protein